VNKLSQVCSTTLIDHQWWMAKTRLQMHF